MSDSINLQDYANGCIESAIYDMTTLDIEKLRDDARDAVGTEAESACTYTNVCREIISRYDSEVDDSEIDDITSGQTFTAGQWQEAMIAYANAVAYVYIGQLVEESINEIEEAAEHLVEEGQAWGSDDIDMDSLRVSNSCPHGWAVHDKEDSDGVCYWSEGHLEGCRAVAIKSNGIWLSYTWTPEAEETEE